MTSPPNLIITILRPWDLMWEEDWMETAAMPEVDCNALTNAMGSAG